jgi:Tfp pilus assembly protein PilX
MRNEKGFTYPISLCILVFFSLFLLIAVEQNVTEKRFYKETENILIAEYYLLSAVNDAEVQLKNDMLQDVGKFQYSQGEVTYHRRGISSDIDEISFTLKLRTNQQWDAIARYDKIQQKMVKWIELN